jgi:hypothetical protein
MDLRKISSEEGDQIDEASRIADHIFMYAVSRTAHMMNAADFDPEEADKKRRAICEEYPELVAGLQTMAIIYAATSAEKR